MISSFSLKNLPQIHFGVGRISEVPGLLSSFGSRVLVILGSGSFTGSDGWKTLQTSFSSFDLVLVEQVQGEPSPEAVDELVNRYRDQRIEVVLAIGGGSVIDAGKAISAMLVEGGEVCRFLEGIGTKKPSGGKIPFIAVPTTAGTGSEATSNAVLSRTGSQGFKRSLRHDNYIPDIAVVDPALTLSCPQGLTVACGMDAFSQLVEAYLSTHSSAFTDALALDGIAAVRRSLEAACNDGGNLSARTDMAYAALLSGIVLAHAGLGVIHGFASSIGGFFAIPHGIICGALMAESNRVTLARLRRTGENPAALDKYSRLGRLFSQEAGGTSAFYQDAFISELTRLELGIGTLGHYGIAETDFDRILDQTGNKYNPAVLDREEMREILSAKL